MLLMVDGYYWWHRYQQPFERHGIKVITQPAEEFLTVAEARDHLRADPTAGDDALILSQIAAARQWCEAYTGRAFCQQHLELGLPRFPGTWARDHVMSGYGFRPSWIDLQTGPVREIDSIVYLADQTDLTAQTTVDPTVYYLDDYSEPARIYQAPGKSWPGGAISVANAVRVRFVAGYDLSSDSPTTLPLPPLARQAMLLMLGHFYENRENELVSESRATDIALITGAAALLDLMPHGKLRVALG